MHRSLITACACYLAVAANAWSADLAITADETHQTIEGFGTCLYPHGPTPAWYDSVDLPKLYVDELGASCVRINLRGHDIPKQEDPSKLRYQDMVLSKRAQVYEKAVKRMVADHPDLRLIATAWTPPAWMKLNQAETGHPFKKGSRQQDSSAIDGKSYRNRKKNGDDDNRVDPQYYPHLAAWCVEVVRYYQNLGANVYGISFGNEVCFSQFFGSCVWTADDYAKAVKVIGEAMAEAGLQDVKLFGPETMSHRDSRSEMYLAAMKANDSLQYLDALATHGYVEGVTEEMEASSSAKQRVLAERYGVSYWVTEGGTGRHEWPAPLEKGIGLALHNALVAGDVSLFTPWQFAGDKGDSHDLRTFAGPTKKTYVAMQFMRFIKPGMQRVTATSDTAKLLCSAYRDDDGVCTVVAINLGSDDQDLQVSGIDGAKRSTLYRTSADLDFAEEAGPTISRGRASIAVPAMSIVTMVCE